VLGDHIDQKGSLVAPTKLRFDFSHKAQIGLKELQQIETISIDWIKKNVKVYTKDLTLEEAYKIPGVRAVFGEAYPDPVRVVVLGYDVDEIARNVENPQWRKTSIEFCGGTHVAKTGDIKEFVIIEESGIAKGIRRIIAVTGQEAQEASRIAGSLKTRLDELERSSGKEKDAGLKALTVELGQADISVLLKAELKDRLASVRKALDKQIKEKETALNKEALNALAKHFEENPNSEGYFAAIEVDGNAKILQNIVMQAKKLNKPAYVFSVDPERTKVAHANFVPEGARSKGFTAKEWASKIGEVIGGKAGGKDESAQGVGANVDKVAEAVVLAKEVFISSST